MSDIMPNILIKGAKYSFCQHYPWGFAEPFECVACAEIAKTAPVYTVTSVRKDSIQLVSGGRAVEITSASDAELDTKLER